MVADDESVLRAKAWDAVRAALHKFNVGKPQDEVCPFCHQALVVEGWPPGGSFSQWDIHCPCGKSNITFKGL